MTGANGGFTLRHASLASAPSTFSAHDPVVLDLRHAHGVLELGDAQMAHGAALVLPMLARGAINVESSRPDQSNRRHS